MVSTLATSKSRHNSRMASPRRDDDFYDLEEGVVRKFSFSHSSISEEEIIDDTKLACDTSKAPEYELLQLQSNNLNAEDCPLGENKPTSPNDIVLSLNDQKVGALIVAPENNDNRLASSALNTDIESGTLRGVPIESTTLTESEDLQVTALDTNDINFSATARMNDQLSSNEVLVAGGLDLVTLASDNHGSNRVASEPPSEPP